jgi:hypothetical protein
MGEQGKGSPMRTRTGLLIAAAVSALIVASAYAALGGMLIRALQISVRPRAATEQMIGRFGR